MRRLHPLDWGIALWVLLAVVSLLWAARQKEAITDLRTMVIEPSLFYLILRLQINDRKKLIMMVTTLLVAGFMVAGIGLLRYAQGEAIITAEDGARRLASVYGSPNNVGLFLGRCIPFALALLLMRGDKALIALRSLSRFVTRRVLTAIGLVTMGVAAALTQSVGALFVGIPIAVAAVLFGVWGKRAWFVIVGIVIVGLLVTPLLLQSERFARVLDFTQGTNFYRLRVWQSALNVIRDHPLTGLGLDQFLYAFRGQYILPDAWQEPNLSHPHNVILDWWVRLGVLGVGLFVGVQIVFWRSVRRLYRVMRQQDRLLFAITIGVMGSMVNLLAHGLIDASIYVQDLAFVYVFLLGAVVHLSNMGAIDAYTEVVV
jgi:O-antigen ligase